MQDLSKIDFSKCKLPEWGDTYNRCVSAAYRDGIVRLARNKYLTFASRTDNGQWRFEAATWPDLETARYYTRQVDAFIESELAKSNEPKWRPCTVEFAFTHPTESEWQCGGDGCGWEPMTKPPGGYCAKNAHHYVFRTKAPVEPEWRPCSKEVALAHPETSQAAHYDNRVGWTDWEHVYYWCYDQSPERYRFRTQVSSPQQPDHLDTRNPGRTYSARGERKVAAKFGDSLGFAGGRENTPRAEIVRSNYYNANQNEANIEITGQCSVETLRTILA